MLMHKLTLNFQLHSPERYFIKFEPSTITVLLNPFQCRGQRERSYTSTPPIGRTACTEPQCLYSTAIPLLPLWAVWPVQSLSACTRVHFTFIV
jgi:hypothetical protein